MWKNPIYRNSYKKRYGSKCFLKPSSKKYPICMKGKISCKGLRAAAYYGRLLKNKTITRKVRKLTHKCI